MHWLKNSLSLECSLPPAHPFSKCYFLTLYSPVLPAPELFPSFPLQLDLFLFWIPRALPVHRFWCLLHCSLHPRPVCPWYNNDASSPLPAQEWVFRSNSESSKRHHGSLHIVGSQYIILKEEYTSLYVILKTLNIIRFANSSSFFSWKVM